MKKQLGCLGLLVLPAVFYAAWITYPSSKYSVQLKEIYDRAQARHEASQIDAKNAKTNGYLDPTFLPYWGRKDIESKPDGQLARQFKKLDDSSDTRNGKEMGLEGKALVQDPQTKALFDEFGAVYDKLHLALALPKFVPPDDKPTDASTLVPNFIAYRAVEQYLSAYAEYLSLSGQSDRALAVCQDMFRFSKAINAGGHTLIQLMISVATRAISQATLAMVLQTGPAGNTGVLQELSKVLADTQFNESDFLDALEDEYYMIANSVAQIGKKPVAGFDETGSKWYRLPGLVSREFRMYQNDYYPILEKARQGDYSSPDWFARFGWSQWLTGQHAYLSSMAIPNSTKAHFQLDLSRKRQAFLHLYVELLLARQKTAKWPANLKELEASGFKALEPLDLDKVAYEVKGDTMELKLTLTEQEMPHPPSDMNQPGYQEWRILDRAEWVMHEPPKKPTPFPD